MNKINSLDRRRFLRGTSFALALPLFETYRVNGSHRTGEPANPKRLGCFYFPDGVPMPLPEDPAFKDWAWFPHGSGAEFTLTKCMTPLEPLRNQITILSGFSHPAARTQHGHNNADQFLTGASTGGGDMEYRNTISLDQEYAMHVGDQTRFSSLVLSTDDSTRCTHAFV